MFEVNVSEVDNKHIKITNFPVYQFISDLSYVFKTGRMRNLFDVTFSFFGKGNFIVHNFFLPELLYMLNVVPRKRYYDELKNQLLIKSWLSKTLLNYNSLIDNNKIKKDIIFTLKPYQEEFINIYNDKKQKYNLKGYILALNMGLGKTLTSLALFHGLHKDAVVIIAPKNTLHHTWRNEINKIFRTPKSSWIIGETPKKSDYYIVNYESIEKLNSLLPFLMNKNIGFVVDESHNFRNVETKRVEHLSNFVKLTKCNDVLFMSGTPIKALGTEMIPVLQIIDPYFDDESREIFKKVFGLSVPIALDVLNNRLGLIMYRKTKSESVILPDKFHHDIKIKTPNGKEYVLDKVKDDIRNFVKEREIYYKLNSYKYHQDYNECMEFLKTSPNINPMELNNYIIVVDELKKRGYDTFDKALIERVKKINIYEKNVLIPILPNELKKKFKSSRAVVKYINLKIMGEVLGGFLNRLRSKMYQEIIRNSPIIDLIKKSTKKTICFTTFKEVVDVTNEYLKSRKFNPLNVYGDNKGLNDVIIEQFKKDINANPLIATIQSLSTGVTLIEANTVIFLNPPYRSVDYEQAYSRVYRIGQESEVNIYNFSLDTGNEPNLSTRMDDIMSWSKEMFSGIVGLEETALLKFYFKLISE